MDVLQLLLWIGDGLYDNWLQRGYRSLCLFVDAADAEYERLGLPERYRLRLPVRPDANLLPDHYARAGLYMPLLEDGEFRRLRQMISLWDGIPSSLLSSRVQFKLNVLDVPECLHWYRHGLVLSAALRWWDSRSVSDPYGNKMSFDSKLLEEAVSVAVLSQSEIVRSALKGVMVECNSLFLLNLFMYTRDRSAFKSWGIRCSATYETVHNQLVSLARTRSWNHIFRVILDGDPEIVNTFQLFKED
jgi:hypothetical protein